ncbi:NAD-dependent epimerase/dehydratase family protein [Pelagibacteraceae bacterium]|nr:NAD-dependent epimerase/dehydratase family protein [Pelagibacteraceae bacterium]
MKKKIYLITGCAGFIGSNLTKELYNKNELILVDDLSSGNIKNLPHKIRRKVIKKKIDSINNLKIKKLDGIFHLCAQASVPFSIKNFYKSSVNNLKSSLKVFEIAKKFKAPVVFASSSAVYGNLPFGDDSSDSVSIINPYAQDKLTIEHYAKLFFKIFKISSIGFRFFNVYGPGQTTNNAYASVIPIFIDRMIKKKKITINGGYQTRDFVYISDVVSILIKTMNKIKVKRSCKVFNLGTGQSIKIDYLFKIIKLFTNTNPKFIRKRLNKFDPKKSSGTFKEMSKYLKLNKYKFVQLHDGLKQTINYFKTVN